jgi:hypothetical protein
VGYVSPLPSLAAAAGRADESQLWRRQETIMGKTAESGITDLQTAVAELCRSFGLTELRSPSGENVHLSTVWLRWDGQQHLFTTGARRRRVAGLRVPGVSAFRGAD